MMMGIVAGQMRPGGGAAPATDDPYWSSVAGLAHFDTGFVDDRDGATWTKTASVAIQSDAGAIGGGCLYNPGDNNWVQRTIPAIGIQDFTLEFRLKRSAVSKVDVIFDLRSAGSTNGMALYKDAAGSATLYFNSSALITANVGTMTAWTSLCVERVGELIRLYKDGVVMGSWSGAASLTNTTLRMLNSIVNSTQYGSQGTQGLLDELRLTIGVARYQGNYTPASAAFPNHSNLPAAIGDAFGGGYYVGDITIGASTFALIMAGAEGVASAQWKTATTATTGTTSTSDGAANTAAMIAAGAAAHPAAQHCNGYAGGGFTDWYLPAIDELAVMMASRAALASVLSLANRGWSSTQHATTSTAWAHDTYSGGIAYNYGKTNSYQARPTRRLLRA